MVRRSTQEWTGILEQAGIPCAPVQTIDQALAHEHTRALGIVQPVPASEMTLVGLPARFDGMRPPIRSASSALDADAALLNPYRTAEELTP